VTDERDWLSTAATLARHVARAAHRHDGRAAWMGTTQAADEETGDLEFTFATIGPELYGGTSGIALFLAEAATRLDDRELRDRAEEGMRHAIARAGTPPPESRLGFYSGAVGIAYAAARVGRLLLRDEFLDDARRLVADLPFDERNGALPLDIIDGAAGAAPALLALARWLQMPALAQDARRLGERLLATATPHDPQAWSWADPDAGDDAPHLTGFAHGAAGIGWAMLALHRATRDDRFLEGAERAFRYEDSLFRVRHANWPDLREATSPDEEVPCGVAWCHGAPGIGLSRARAMAASPRRSHHDDTVIALGTTMRALALLDADAEGDGSLCHGRAGMVEIALELSTALADEAEAAPSAAAALASAAAAAARYSSDPDRWPVGVARGTNPSLMLGLAGIGYSYLRLADPTLASVLEPGRGAA
jgi:lantibiotic biosynthesis protein